MSNQVLRSHHEERNFKLPTYIRPYHAHLDDTGDLARLRVHGHAVGVEESLVGHETISTTPELWKDVKTVQTGDCVDVCTQIASYYERRLCVNNNGSRRANEVYQHPGQHPEGTRTQGGYSTGVIAHEQLVFPTADGLISEESASILYPSVTVLICLVRNGASPSKRVEATGTGTLGLYIVLFANALDTKVYAFTSFEHKVEDIKEMGATHFVVMNGDFAKELAFEVELIVSTRDMAEGFSLMEYMSMLDVHGHFAAVGLLDESLPGSNAMSPLGHGAVFRGSHSAGKKECLQIIQLVVDKSVKP